MRLNSRVEKMLSSGRYMDYAILVLRVVIGALMFTHGITKVQEYSFMVNDFPDPFGLGRGLTLTLVALVEVSCSCLIVMGFFLRPAALVLAFVMFVAAFLAFPSQTFAQAELAFTYMSIYVVLVISGAGRYSLDRLYFVNLESKG